MKQPYLSVIIPAYREERRIGKSLQSLFRYFQTQAFAVEVIVVDDGSPDRTSEVVRLQTDSHVPVVCLRHSMNRGKGAAVRTGMLRAQGDYALIYDADGSTPIDEVEKLLQMMRIGFDCAIGSRYLPASQLLKKQPFGRRLMGRVGNTLFHVVLGLRFTDTRCGFKLFSRAARKRIFPLQRLERFGFDTEILVIARELGLRVAEVPVRWQDHGALSTIHPFRDSLRSLKEVYDIVRHRRAGKYREH